MAAMGEMERPSHLDVREQLRAARPWLLRLVLPCAVVSSIMACALWGGTSVGYHLLMEGLAAATSPVGIAAGLGLTGGFSAATVASLGVNPNDDGLGPRWIAGGMSAAVAGCLVILALHGADPGAMVMGGVIGAFVDSIAVMVTGSATYRHPPAIDRATVMRRLALPGIWVGIPACLSLVAHAAVGVGDPVVLSSIAAGALAWAAVAGALAAGHRRAASRGRELHL